MTRTVTDALKMVDREDIDAAFQVGTPPLFIIPFVGVVGSICAWMLALISGAYVLVLSVWALIFFYVVGRAMRALRNGRVLWPQALLDSRALYLMADLQGNGYLPLPWRRIKSARADIVGLNVRGITLQVDVGGLTEAELSMFDMLYESKLLDTGFMHVGFVSGVNKRDEIIDQFKSIGGVI